MSFVKSPVVKKLCKYDGMSAVLRLPRFVPLPVNKLTMGKLRHCNLLKALAKSLTDVVDYKDQQHHSKQVEQI